MSQSLLSAILGGVALVVGLGLMVSATSARLKLERGGVVVSWVGVVAVAGLSALGQMGGVPAALVSGAFGASAAVPLDVDGEVTAGRLVIPAATTLTLAVGAVIAGRPALSLVAPEPWRAAATLYVVLFAAGGAAVSLFGAGAFRGWSQSDSSPAGRLHRVLGGVVVAVGPLIAVTGLRVARSPSAPEGGIPLVDGEGEALVWALPGAVRELSTRSFRAVAAMPEWVSWCGFGAVGIAILVASLESFGGERLVRAAWGVFGTAMVIAGVWGWVAVSGGFDLPSAEAFIQRAETLLADSDFGQQLAQRGEFSGQGAEVDWMAMLPIGLAWLWSAVAAIALALLPRVDAGSQNVRPGAPTVRACLVVWACWFVAGLVHWRLAGVVGLHSPSEWIGLGVACVATGASLISVEWAPRARSVTEAQSRLSVGAGIALLAVLLCVATGVWTGVPAMVSIPT